MYNSILQFLENDIPKLKNVFELLVSGEKDSGDYSLAVEEAVRHLAQDIVGESYELLDQMIKESAIRKQNWTVERKEEVKELLDVVGTIRFKRTGYVNKTTGEYIYLLDQVLGLDSHQRITIPAAARILEETIESSYRKGGEAASPEDFASKQTVKRLVHDTVIETPKQEVKDKRKIKQLHIVADEDHVSAQFWKEKGDLEKNSAGNKINTIMTKIICVFEDIIDESGNTSKSPRFKLLGKHYFSGIHKGGTANLAFWGEVADYINATYDTEVLERVYIAGDGAAWIKAGTDVIEKSKYVLDKFHTMKYINLSVAHLLDSKDEVKSEIWECITTGNKKELKNIYQHILDVTDEENKYKEVENAYRYFMNQWDGIKIRVEEAGAGWSCCAEGQVSHVLSARMSSRPMGWSEHGCDQMAKLRAYHWNDGKVIDLIRFQKKKQEKEEQRKEKEELIESLRKRRSGWSGEEQLRAQIPGLEQSTMSWLRNVVNGTYSA